MGNQHTTIASFLYGSLMHMNCIAVMGDNGLRHTGSAWGAALSFDIAATAE